MAAFHGAVLHGIQHLQPTDNLPGCEYLDGEFAAAQRRNALGDVLHAAVQGIDPALLHRIAVIGAGTLDSLPHNGAVITLLAVCGSTHRKSYFDIVMCCVVSAMLALIAVIIIGGMFGSF